MPKRGGAGTKQTLCRIVFKRQRGVFHASGIVIQLAADVAD
jgi:hypothetical protein